MIGIYKITSPTNRVYIGQSINIEKRFKQYKNLQNVSEQKALYNSFLKYGVDNHTFEIVEECEINLLNERERFYQEFYNVINKGLNCFLTNTNEKKRVFSKETKEKMKESAKNKFFSETHRKNIGIAVSKRDFMMSFKGKKHNENTKKLLSERQKGVLNHNFGKKASIITKTKMSLKRKGDKNPMYGKKHSAETVLKIKQNRSIPKNKKGKIVLNIETGIFYESAKKASTSLNINYITLNFKLNGRLKNNTPFIYV
jgi:group I intron endonuclease